MALGAPHRSLDRFFFGSSWPNFHSFRWAAPVSAAGMGTFDCSPLHLKRFGATSLAPETLPPKPLAWETCQE
jgi:hypothetical protein